MNCDFCTQPVEGQATASVSCCTRVYHTACLVKKTIIETQNSNYYDVTIIKCGCQASIYQEVNQYYEAPSQVQPQDVSNFLETAENREEVKQIRRKNTIMNKSRIAFARFLRERKLPFKDALQPHIDSLKAVKRAEELNIKSSNEWKEYTKHYRNLTSSYKRFRDKHNFNINTIRELLGQSLRHRYYNRPARLLIRFLRTKV